MLMTFQLFAAFLASGASIPTTISSTSFTSKSVAAVNNTSDSSLTAKPYCIIPSSRYTDISIRACQPALNQLMQQPDPSSRIEYHWFGLAIHLTGAPCIVSLDCAGPSSDITLSAREIVGYAYSIIATCELAGSGWMQIDGSKGWLVTVMAAGKNGIANATIGETGNTSFLEGQGERHIELPGSS